MTNQNNQSTQNSNNSKVSKLTWIKINIDIFDNVKIKELERLPKGDTYLVIWFKLLCFAGKINDNGMIYLTEGEPYTVKSLAHMLGRSEKMVGQALEQFERLKMISIRSGYIGLFNWQKYQSIDRINEIKRYYRTKKTESNMRIEQKFKQISNEIQQSSIIDIDIDVDVAKNKI